MTFVNLHAQNKSTLQEHLAYFSSLPDRISGTPGSNQTVNYIVENLRLAGIRNIQTEEFKVVVPVQKHAYLKIGNKQIPLESLWPNSVRTCTTPPEGFTGKLLYCDQSGLKSLNGKEISENIVIMDFNTDTLWLDIASLGARAILFIEPDETSRIEAEKKFSQVPLHVPRFYLRKQYAQEVIKRR